jgi:hypothetical protein
MRVELIRERWRELAASDAERHATLIQLEREINERDKCYSGELADKIEAEMAYAIGDIVEKDFAYLRAMMTSETVMRLHMSKDKKLVHCFIDINVFTSKDEVARDVEDWKAQGGMVFTSLFPIGTTECMRCELEGLIGTYVYHKHGENIVEPVLDTYGWDLAEYDAYIRDLGIHELIYLRETAQLFAKKIERMEPSLIH